MTLSKQLISLVIAIFIAIYVQNFIISINNMKSYLQLESKSHAQDTATSLALSLSPYIDNPTDSTIATMMNAIFDRGYYKDITLKDPDGKIIVQLINKKIFTEVPKWFKDWLVINTAIESSDVSSGWSLGGTVYVTSNPGYAYLKLFEQAKNGVVSASISFAIALFVLLIFLKFILSPLKRIEQLAKSIAAGKFEVIEKLPWTTEIKNVAIAMNDMSRKIEGIISKLNANLEGMNKKLKIDTLTNLDIKGTFETDMKKMFIAQSNGYIYLVKIDDLASFAKENGNENVDRFIKEFANTLKNSIKVYLQDHQDEKLKAYRFYGSEFAILADKQKFESAQEFSKLLMKNLEEIGAKFNKKDVSHIGGTPFNPISTTPDILGLAEKSCTKAKEMGANQIQLRDNKDLEADMNAWRELVSDIILNKKFEIDLINDAHNFKSDKTFIKEVFSVVKDREGKAIPIGTFVSIAEKYDLVIGLDIAVTQKAIEYIKLNDIDYDIAVNLSLDTLINSKFKSWLNSILKDNKNIANRLVFSITSYGAAKNIENFKSFIDFTHSLGAKIVLKRFETQFISLDSIKDFNLDYIRLARDYTSGIAREEGKQKFVEAMVELGDLLNVVIFAESLNSDADYDILKEIGLYGGSR